LSILKRYPSKKLALLSIVNDIKDFIKEHKNIEINEANDRLDNKPNGWYFRKSSKYQDRINVYEKRSEVVSQGYLWNSYAAKVFKMFVFSMFEDPAYASRVNINPEMFQNSLKSLKIMKKISDEIDSKAQNELIKELKQHLENRRSASNQE
jgi:hypothetical protein